MTIFQKTAIFFLHFCLVVLFFVCSSFSPLGSGINKSPSFAPLEDFGSVPCLNKKVSIIAYIVKDSLGVPPPPPDPANIEQQILDAIDSANKDFSPICLSFKVCEFVYIDNYQYDLMDTLPNADTVDDVKSVIELYYKPNVINMYFVSNYVPSDPDECGQSYMPPSAQNPDTLDFIAIGKQCFPAPAKAISHALGHFFGLYHTFANPGSELADGSNCAIAGDSLCDTPADPKGTADGSCNYTGPFLDPNGVFYFPPIDNIMSYYKDCRCRFTREQYLRMAQQYLASRTYLW